MSDETPHDEGAEFVPPAESEPDETDADDTEETDADDTEETPQQPPDEAPQQSSEARMEEIGRKLDGLQKHVTKRLGEILGDDAVLFEECEVCSYSNTPGWRPEGPYPQAVVDAVLRAMGQTTASDLSADTHSQVCSDCNGYGVVASGSKVAGQDTLVCVRCVGKGWTATDEKRQSPFAGSSNGPTPTPTPVDDPAIAAPDPSIEDAAAVAALKAAGYTVIAPFQPVG